MHNVKLDYRIADRITRYEECINLRKKSSKTRKQRSKYKTAVFNNATSSESNTMNLINVNLRSVEIYLESAFE